ncbi:dTDP-glucose 4,6-dehydratase [bioreactor metagenome]|uniref:dTDP-glucose 4,6-dehydratase n=1 Tax=bioreactor metagenome TaxID=1076179 RepID=A0A644VQG4_9ZZZZ
MKSFENKIILITGATGLIGYSLVEHLLNHCATRVIVTGRNQEKLESTFSNFLNNRNLVLLELDAAQEIPSYIGDIDYIFHAAGPMERDIILHSPVNIIKPNIFGIFNCLEFLKNQTKNTGKKGRLVVFSSVTVYYNPTNEDLIVSEDNTNCGDFLDSPTISYSESKRMSEVIAKAYKKQFDIDIVIARLGTVYGESKNIPETAFYEFIKKAFAGQDIVLNNSGFNRRDNIYVKDAINGLVTLSFYGQSGESYNISSGGEKGNFAGIDEIANYIAEAVSSLTGNKKIQVIYSAKPIRIPGIVLNNNKLKKLGWRLETSLEEGIIKTLRSYECLKKNN